MEAGAYNQKAKLGLRHLGLDCGEVRPPLLPLGDEAAAALVDVLDAVLSLMRLVRSAAAIEVHAEGEQGTCYLGSPFDVPGRTAGEKLHHLNCVDDTVRRILTHRAPRPAAGQRQPGVPLRRTRGPTPPSSSSRRTGRTP